MNFLIIGDIYSKSGRDVIEKNLDKVVKENNIDFIIANGENISHGKGINKNHYDFLKNKGVNVITSGNHIFKVKETFEFIEQVDDLLRPANMNSYNIGLGTNVYNFKDKKIRVTNLMGKSFMEHVNNPYEVMDKIMENDNSDIHIVDFHAEASAEKLAFAWNYDGKITALVGTHTHVQTADERILPKGTAFITDLGMTGPINSIIGANPDEVIFKEKTGLPTKFKPSENPGILCAVVVCLDNENNCKKIKRIQVI
ncbi:TIGR00282 family metallophosphoesterase [Spiroplasma sp. BIUS-1]|uniref:TIGR00282 family metallophosphoesterase n=1 Tax=Spiroplasma sp. BIUS-1 TaxID=216964 RepID=UPI001397D40D|nr:TIGR00282 family metallophosphoesterase [Spiroplasma sp. BIUS-1]QHX36899.1 TIGR00282 family metallophosphoesterase [Spiroplasma sp. BIUS-1]